MKLKDYAKHIAELAKDYPNATVIYSQDTEGNDFKKVVFTPTAGHIKMNEFGDIVTFMTNSENSKYYETDAVCIN
jgi:hypothetical protein